MIGDRFSIRGKLLAGFTGVTVLTVGLAGGVMAWRERVHLQAAHLTGVRSSLHQLALESHEALLAPSVDMQLAMDALVAQLAKEEGVIRISVVRPDGTVFVPIALEGPARYTPPPGGSRAEETREENYHRYAAADGSEALHLTVPVFHGQTLIGQLEADYSEEHIARALRESTLTALGVLGAVLGVGLVLVVLISAFLARPVRALTDRINGLGFSPEAAGRKRGGDEVAELRAAFDRLWSSLQASVKEIASGARRLAGSSASTMFLPRHSTVSGHIGTDALGGNGDALTEVRRRLDAAMAVLGDLARRREEALRLVPDEAGKGNDTRFDEGVLQGVFRALDVATADVVFAHEMLETVLREAGEAIAVSDPTGRITFLNSRAGECLGVRPGSEAAGIWNVLEERFGWTQADTLAALQDITKPGGRYEREVELTSPARVYRLSLTGVFDPGGRVLAQVFVFADLTHLAELNRRKTEIVNLISHEMRSPLSVIQAYGELLQDTVAGEQETARQVDLILQQSGRLRRLIDTFLDISRIESGRQELRLAAVDLGSLVGQTLDGLSPRAREKSIRLAAEIPKALPAVQADADLLQQVFINLVSNAIEYSPDGRDVRVSVEACEGGVRAAVQDQGYGLKEEELAKLFQKFFRASSSRHRKGKGTGLGLAFVKEVVERHGGTVGVQSRAGEGSTFWFELPGAPG